jgi:hypothetical protein
MRHVHHTAWIFIALLLAPDSARSQPAESDSLRRWGFGWEAEVGSFYSSFASGIGIRYRASPEWGIGLIVNPFLDGDDAESRSSSTSSGGSMEVSRTSGDDEGYRLFAAAMVYREARVGKWLGVGPYAGIGYQRGRVESSDLRVEERADDLGVRTSTAVSRSESWWDEWSLSVGLRPTFTVEKRFVLETRLGVDISFRHNEGDASSRRVSGATNAETEEDVSRSSNEWDSWDLTVLGQNLGPGATMTFIVYF